MYRKVVNYLRGSVAAQVESAYPERVLNLWGERNIPFWDLRWSDETTFTVKTSVHALPELRQAAEGIGGRVRVVGERGVPLLLRHVRKRYALLAGLAIFLVMLLAGNVFICEFRVTGNETVPTEAILRSLEEYGIRVGTVGLRLDQKAMRNHVLLELPDLSWLAVNVKGCVAHVQVVERRRPPQTVQEDQVTNMVALRSGLVTRVEPLDGKAQVAAGSTVTEGQLLISGVVDSSRTGVRFLHGAGSVWARTWYDLSVLVPLREVQQTAQTEKATRLWLNIGKRQIKLWAKGSILQENCGKILHYGAVCLPGGFRLPVTVVKEETVSYDTAVRQRTVDEARAEGEAELLALLQAQMTPEGTITSTRFSCAEKGKYLLVNLQAECHEQIAGQVVLPQP